MIKEKKTVMIWRRYLTVYKNSGIEVLSHIQTDWRIDMADGTITAKQKEILEYIKSEILKRGFPPAVREICEAVHLKSTSSVHSHLESLERKGYIRRDPTKPRAIEILDDSFQLLRKEMVNVPIVGKIAAGSPLLAVENIESYFPIPSEYLPNAQTFLLEVKGESMINAGVLSGDHILVKQQDTAENGEMVAALIDDSATVKTFYHENGHIRLQPENDTMDCCRGERRSYSWKSNWSISFLFLNVILD